MEQERRDVLHHSDSIKFNEQIVIIELFEGIQGERINGFGQRIGRSSVND